MPVVVVGDGRVGGWTYQKGAACLGHAASCEDYGWVGASEQVVAGTRKGAVSSR